MDRLSVGLDPGRLNHGTKGDVQEAGLNVIFRQRGDERAAERLERDARGVQVGGGDELADFRGKIGAKGFSLVGIDGLLDRSSRGRDAVGGIVDQLLLDDEIILHHGLERLVQAGDIIGPREKHAEKKTGREAGEQLHDLILDSIDRMARESRFAPL